MNPTRLAIVRYKLAARAYRRDAIRYSELEAARAAMFKALGYERAYSYMGEFCNLHERDIPSHIKASARPCYYDKAHAAAGRIYRYSGFQQPVDLATHRANCTTARQRSRYLQSIFLLSPVDRFIHGWSIVYLGKDGKGYMTAWRGSSSYLTVLETIGMFDRRLEWQGIMSEPEARAFFAGISDPHFQDNYHVADWGFPSPVSNAVLA